MSYPDPYQPPPAVAPQPAAKRDNGNSRVWRILDTVMDVTTGTTGNNLGDTAKARVLAMLMIFGIVLVGIAILVLVLVLMH
jgi:hypothetical protein